MTTVNGLLLILVCGDELKTIVFDDGEYFIFSDLGCIGYMYERPDVLVSDVSVHAVHNLHAAVFVFRGCCHCQPAHHVHPAETPPTGAVAH